MDLNFFIAAGVLIIIVLPLSLFSFYTNSINPNASKCNAPPQAGGARLFTGHLHVMSPGELPHITLGAMADRYGPIFTIGLGGRRALVVSSAKLAKDLFTTCDGAISSRPDTASSRNLGYERAMFGFSPYGPYWREVRKLISTEVLSARRLELQRHVLMSETSRSINELWSLWSQNADVSGRVSVEMKQWFGDLNLNTILRMVVGKRFFGSGGGDNDEARRCQRVMRDFFHLAGVFVLGDTMPYLRWLDVGGYEKKMKETSKELDLLVGQWLEEHRDREILDKGEDFMDVMICVVRGAKFQNQYDPDIIIKSTCSNLISGASDTTSIMLVWALALLLNNKHALIKVQQELDDHVGRERRVNHSDIDKLLYLHAVVKETLRLYPAAPLNGPREFTQGCELGTYNVPKGTILFVNIWKLHRDPELWPDPLEFRPERFLTTHRHVDVKDLNFEFIPFGGGRRICPGVNYGMRMLHLVLASLLQAFDIWSPNDKVVDMSESGGLTNSKATPLDVLVAPRLIPSLY
ncbi:flavonoid-6-hydroxylase-like [Salvia miltiorrhiza]|uniref:flavonoid-6-hydroxylase-like n=1 Tax=Salvia miltiorrhiza TaxID=226208 RepID=UPI0025AD73B0|nr:flavonoid-6-hydroxylase-like [Salvia miltiorrhiza]